MTRCAEVVDERRGMAQPRFVRGRLQKKTGCEGASARARGDRSSSLGWRKPSVAFFGMMPGRDLSMMTMIDMSQSSFHAGESSSSACRARTRPRSHSFRGGVRLGEPTSEVHGLTRGVHLSRISPVFSSCRDHGPAARRSRLQNRFDGQTGERGRAGPLH